MNSPDATPTRRIVRLIGVYDADATMRGELAYWVGARGNCQGIWDQWDLLAGSDFGFSGGVVDPCSAWHA